MQYEKKKTREVAEFDVWDQVSPVKEIRAFADGNRTAGRFETRKSRINHTPPPNSENTRGTREVRDRIRSSKVSDDEFRERKPSHSPSAHLPPPASSSASTRSARQELVREPDRRSRYAFEGRREVPNPHGSPTAGGRRDSSIQDRSNNRNDSRYIPSRLERSQSNRRRRADANYRSSSIHISPSSRTYDSMRDRKNDRNITPTRNRIEGEALNNERTPSRKYSSDIPESASAYQPRPIPYSGETREINTFDQCKNETPPSSAMKHRLINTAPQPRSHNTVSPSHSYGPIKKDQQFNNYESEVAPGFIRQQQSLSKSSYNPSEFVPRNGEIFTRSEIGSWKEFRDKTEEALYPGSIQNITVPVAGEKTIPRKNSGSIRPKGMDAQWQDYSEAKHEGRITELSDITDNQRKRILELETAYNKSQLVVESQGGALSTAQGQIDGLNDYIASLRTQLEDMSKGIQESNQSGGVNDQLRYVTQQKQELECQKADALSQLEKAKKQIIALEGTLARSQMLFDSQEGGLITARGQIDNLSEIASRLQGELHQAKAETAKSEDTIMKLKDQCKNLLAENNVLERLKGNLEKQLAANGIAPTNINNNVNINNTSHPQSKTAETDVSGPHSLSESSNRRRPSTQATTTTPGCKTSEHGTFDRPMTFDRPETSKFGYTISHPPIHGAEATHSIPSDGANERRDPNMQFIAPQPHAMYHDISHQCRTGSPPRPSIPQHPGVWLEGSATNLQPPMGVNLQSTPPMTFVQQRQTPPSPMLRGSQTPPPRQTVTFQNMAPSHNRSFRSITPPPGQSPPHHPQKQSMHDDEAGSNEETSDDHEQSGGVLVRRYVSPIRMPMPLPAVPFPQPQHPPFNVLMSGGPPHGGPPHGGPPHCDMRSLPAMGPQFPCVFVADPHHHHH
eukprot:GHVL01010427.1.p1 GENE.GHVL01010427.1~~GHVL01010427.1.p1  ORF type:complete len:907 (-),score=143.59 GHVL01010427.1:517-3237(-)